MALIVTWAVTSLKKTNVNDLTGVVVQTNWTYTATDDVDGVSGTFYGATPFDLADVSPDDFIQYEELTEEQVLDWIKAVVVDDYLAHVDQQVMREIHEKRIAIVDVGEGQFPWSGGGAA